jgi:YD repeat-containing protein
MRAFPAAFVSLVTVALAWGVPARPMAARAEPRPATGIREQISTRDQARYQTWKAAFLSAEIGQNEWETYARDPRLVLTITTSSENRHGAGIGKYEWDGSGHLVAATVTLGDRLDEEYPEPIYYPVMNALKQDEFRYAISRSTLAATKIAHEFGHLNRMVGTDPAVYRLQTELVPSYNTIIRNNGWNPRDPRLLDLARRMGGTPLEIWEDREYWGEANAMLYLRDHITNGALRCSLFSYIIRNVDTYARGYRNRFAQIADSQPATGRCGT